MNKLFGLILGLLFVGSVLADIPPPPVAQEIRIEINLVSREDYQFYLVSYDLKVVPNPNPPHPSRPNMIVNVPDSFQMKKIELSNDKPYSEPLGSGRIQYRGSVYDKTLYLVAIKKSQVAELEPKIKETIDKNQLGDYAIRFVNLHTSIDTKDDKSAKVIVNKISLDAKDMIVTVEEGTTSTVSATSGKTTNCIGLGFLLTGIALFGGWFGRRKFKSA